MNDGPYIPVRIGDVLAGKYRVERVLGMGGMGVVVAAHHLQLDERVALKFLLTDGCRNPDALARFEREARAAVKIKSQHVARVTDVGRLETGAPYMVMEYLEGGDLQMRLHERGPLSLELAVELVLQACEAIAEAHVLGIVHRDLKPANLYCVKRVDGLPFIKVLDFGISKRVAPGSSSNSEASVTSTSAIVGSPLFMSPEQIQSSKGVDWRTDIWSLGVILYELVSGRLPFDAEQMTELVVKIATQAPVRLLAQRPDLPLAFEQVVLGCLEKERERRFQNVGHLASALLPFAPKRAQASVDRILRTMDAGGVPQSMSPGSQPESPPAESPRLAVVGTQASWGNTGAAERKRGKAPRVVAIGFAALLALLALLAGGVKLGAPSDTRGAGATPRSLSAAAPAQRHLDPESMVQPAETPPPGATSSEQSDDRPSSPVSPATARSRARSPHPALPIASTVSSAASAPPPRSSSPNCDPPYSLDDQGRKHFKPECYLGH
ncbi:MAG TPA: protein kinase [Polyangiaceae bacterium]